MTALEVGSDAWLHHVALTIRAPVVRLWGADTCVISTLLSVEVLRYFGIASAPEPVYFAAYSPEAVATLAPDGAGVWRHARGHSVGVTGTGAVVRRDGRLRWDGHLVARLLDRPRLLDVSLDQASRPDRGLRLDPAVVPLCIQWGARGARALLTRDDGAVIVYEPMRCAGAPWRQHSAYTQSRADRRAVAGYVIRTLTGIETPTRPPDTPVGVT